VVAHEPMRCITLSATGLKKVLVEEPRIALEMLSTMAHRVAELDRKIY
jgi:hypothetical protein